MLDADVRHRLGAFALEARLTVDAGRVLVLVGESGSGKTTLLRIVAGLIAPDAGRVAIRGVPMFDRALRLEVPAWRRPVGYLAQDYALFPHLSARDNVAFGLRASGLPASAVRERTEHAIESFALGAFARRHPHELSGGQQQRVALARALVLEPDVLLLDEPLAALDVQTRRTVRGELRRVLDGLECATLFVTHSPTEALAFGEDIAVLEAGRVVQHGPRSAFLRDPRSAYVAEFLGVNLLRGEVAGRAEAGLVTVRVEGGELLVADPHRDGAVDLVLHPREITLSLEAPGGSARNVLRGAIEELIPEPPDGDRVRVLLATAPPLAAEVTRSAVESLGLRAGTRVYASFKASGVVVLAE